MRLNLVREHYSKRVGNTWIPKRSFETTEDIKKELGFDPDKCLLYTCSFCHRLHMFSPEWKIK